MDYIQNITESVEFLLAFVSLMSFILIVVGLFGYFYADSGKSKRYYLTILISGIITLTVLGPDIGIKYFRIRY